MPSEFVLTYECESCGKEIKNFGLDLSNDVPHIPIESLSQTDFECFECDKTFSFGDIDVIDVDELFE